MIYILIFYLITIFSMVFFFKKTYNRKNIIITILLINFLATLIIFYCYFFKYNYNLILNRNFNWLQSGEWGYIIFFIGWEGIDLISFLLINFFKTRSETARGGKITVFIKLKIEFIKRKIKLIYFKIIKNVSKIPFNLHLIIILTLLFFLLLFLKYKTNFTISPLESEIYTFDNSSLEWLALFT